jgi:hypothetical protein
VYRQQQREEKTPPTNTDLKGAEARRSLRPFLRSTTTNSATMKTPIHITRYMSADTCGVEAIWKSSSSHYQRRRFRWLSRLGCMSKAVRLLGLRVRILPEAQMSVSGECWVLSDRGLCVWPIPSPKEFYRVHVSLDVIMRNNTTLHLQ